MSGKTRGYIIIFPLGTFSQMDDTGRAERNLRYLEYDAQGTPSYEPSIFSVNNVGRKGCESLPGLAVHQDSGVQVHQQQRLGTTTPYPLRIQLVKFSVFFRDPPTFPLQPP